jgi:hypothetical protein
MIKEFDDVAEDFPPLKPYRVGSCQVNKTPCAFFNAQGEIYPLYHLLSRGKAPRLVSRRHAARLAFLPTPEYGLKRTAPK